LTRARADAARPSEPPDDLSIFATPVTPTSRGIGVALTTSMSDEPPARDDVPDDVIHSFTVQRGMAVAIVIETRNWYQGLLQAAATRIRLEGQN
jgi:hypothetical protein